jgi:hypothetical protein
MNANRKWIVVESGTGRKVAGPFEGLEGHKSASEYASKLNESKEEGPKTLLEVKELLFS